MGGQGGGVLADWIVWLAESEGWAAQSTSVPGVAQRTGATIYYIEMAPLEGWRGAGVRAHADAGRSGRGDGGRAHGGRPFGAARPRHARPDDADRFDPPGAGRGGETGARRRRRRSGRRVCRHGIRRQACHRLQYGGDGQGAGKRHFREHVRRACRVWSAAVCAPGLRGGDPRRRNWRRVEFARLQRRLRSDERQSHRTDPALSSRSASSSGRKRPATPISTGSASASARFLKLRSR